MAAIHAQSVGLQEALAVLLSYQRRGQRLLQGVLGRSVALDDVVFYAAATLGALSTGVRVGDILE